MGFPAILKLFQPLSIKVYPRECGVAKSTAKDATNVK